MSDLWTLIEADYQASSWMTREERERWLGEMAKDMPAKSGESYERKPWKKGIYSLKCIKSEEVPNPYYKTPESLTQQYGEQQPEGFWLDKKMNRIWPDDPIEQTQFKITFTVLDGEKTGDWHSEFVPHRFGFKKDGTYFGKRAHIMESLVPGWTPEHGIESDNSDMIGQMCLAALEPKANPDYAKATMWLPMDTADRAKYVLDAETVTVEGERMRPEDTIGDDDIPFHHLPYDSLSVTRCGHTRW